MKLKINVRIHIHISMPHKKAPESLEFLDFGLDLKSANGSLKLTIGSI